MLQIKNLIVKAEDKEILKDFNLDISDGEIHVLMGPNGAGKSTICKVLLHHPDYIVNSGNIFYNNKDLINMTTTDIAREGIFLLNQLPTEIEGITNSEMIRNAIGEKTGEKVDIFSFNKKLNDVCKIIGLSKEFVYRDINFNMSGGEKKKNELLHLFLLEPNFIILDEIDSGLDVDALKNVGEALRKYYEEKHPSILIVTHHGDILKYFDDYQVHILKNGHIIKSSDKTLVEEIEKNGFDAFDRANMISRNESHE